MRTLLFFFIILIPLVGNAQGSYQAGVLPSLSLNAKFPKDWSLNVKAESRQAFYQGIFGEKGETSYDYVLTDLALIAARKTGIRSAVGGGYVMRIREGAVFHRSAQQMTFTRPYPRFRLAHRFAADQTFSTAEKPAFRLRYRLAAEIPLNGDRVDPGEFYLKAGNEYLNEWQGGDYGLEIRWSPFLGYAFEGGGKLEGGLDYRLDSFLEDASRHRFWIGINWYFASLEAKRKP
jgi:hypothetical protein